MSAQPAAPQEPGDGTPPPPADPARARRPAQARVCATSGGGGRRRGGGGGRARVGAAPARRPRGTRGGGRAAGRGCRSPRATGRRGARGGGGSAGAAGSGLQTGAKTGRERSRSRWRRGRRATRGTEDAGQPPGQLSPSGGACRARRRAARSQAPARPLHSTHCASAPAPPLLMLLPPRPLHFYGLDSSTAPHGACAAPSLASARGPVRPPSLPLLRSRARRPGFFRFSIACAQGLGRRRVHAALAPQVCSSCSYEFRVTRLPGQNAPPHGRVLLIKSCKLFYFTCGATLSLGTGSLLSMEFGSL